MPIGFDISKEAFAQEVLDRYFAHTKEMVREALDDTSLSPRQRLRRYLDIISGVLADDQWNRGCLIGDLSLEIASRSDLQGMACAVRGVHRRGSTDR